jgi:hypothetical protein
MAATTPQQNAAIDAVITKLHTLAAQIQDGFNAADNAGDDARAMQLADWHHQVLQREFDAGNLRIIATANALQPAVDSLATQVKTLTDQRQQIDAAVNAIGTVATVLATISQLATAISSLVAIV